MRGARHYRPDVSTKLKKCSEHVGDDCNDCCSVTPCNFCLELEIYGEDIIHGLADDPNDTKHWTGTVGGYSFDAYWERNYETDVCEFIVEFNGEIVYQQPCGYISCRDSSDEVSVVVIVDGYEEDAVLRWRKHEPLPLEHATDYETGCKTFFCGNCTCSCDCLCVTIYDPFTSFTQGEICNTSYPCDPPIWEGTIAGYELSLALARDEDGNCVIEATIDGVEQDPVTVTGCANMSAQIILYDGTIIDVACKICSCPETQPPCCNRALPKDCFTGEASTDPDALPATLTVDLTATPSFGSATCFNGSGTITFKTPSEGGLCCWEGRISGTCTNCNGETYNWYVDITVCCGDEEAWTVTAIPSLPCVLDGRESVTVPASCDPVLLAGCYEPIVGCVTACLDTMPPSAGPTYTMCFEIYETP